MVFVERVSYCHLVEAFRDMDCPHDLVTIGSFVLYSIVNTGDILT
jgi:hypothetical protein